MYEFKKQDAYDFATFMHIHTKERNGELHFQKCPMCGAKTTDKETFAISLQTGQFKCLRSSCGYSGNMITLAKDFDFSLGNEVDEYIAPKKTFRTYKRKQLTPTDKAVEYLKSRGISEAITRRYDITTRQDQPNTLVFPFTMGDEWKMIKYRKTDFVKGRDKNKEWCEADMQPILFGMQNCNLENKTLIITEGQIDSLSVAECNIENAVSVPHGANGFTWVPYCWKWMQNFDTLIVFGDHENGHITLLEGLKQRFKMRIKHVRPEDYKDCKDANDILRKYGKDQIRACIANAVDEPISHVKHMSEIVRRNPYDIPKIPTGIHELDVNLYGGLPLGAVVLITGKTGEGKSVFASQVLLNAVESGHKCFAYSGELPDWAFQSIIEFQAAGSHVFMSRDRFGIEKADISEANAKLIDAWLNDALMIYDDSLAEDGEETERLTDTIEKVIQREGVEVILLDNLMTGIELDGLQSKTLYERQSEFVKRLARIARSRNVLIILVAHMRKNNGNWNGNDEVAGSSDISNLASINLMYESDNELAPGQRRLKIWKDRLFGHRNVAGYVLNYEEKSKRIYGTGDDVKREYGWHRPEFEQVTVPDEVPFE